MSSREGLQVLDQLRLDNPRKANKLLRVFLKDCPRELMSEALAALGASFRQLDQLANSRWAYYAGEQWAIRSGDLLIQGAIRQKLSFVEFADGNFQSALTHLRTALGIFCELGDRNRQGTVFVDLAKHYHDREMLKSAQPCAKKALNYLNPCEHQYRIGAHQVLAVTFQGEGESAKAVQHLERAKDLSSNCGVLLRARVLWLEARMKNEMHPCANSAATFLDAADLFLEMGEVFDSALATLEFVACSIEIGNSDRAYQAALKLKKIAFKAEGQLTSSILTHVYTESLRGRLTSNLLEAAILKLSSGAAGTAPSRAIQLG